MILLVDKDPISADSIAYYLEAAGYEVETMFDAHQALERAAELDPELVLMEVILSGVNGLVLAQAFTSDPRTCHLPVLMVSVLAAEPRAMKAGAAGFLLKPVNRQQLLLAVSDARSAGGRSS